MPKPRVYVETTIPSFYHDPRTSPPVLARRRWTRLWWTGAGEHHELVTSEFVLDELAAGSTSIAGQRLALLESVLTLRSSPEVERIAEIYIQNKLMPSVPRYDALHLALASSYRCDLIVTWNCKHLANPNKAEHVERINRSLGLYVPRLVTPQDLLGRQA